MTGLNFNFSGENSLNGVLANNPSNSNLQEPAPELLGKILKKEEPPTVKYQPQSLPEYMAQNYQNYSNMPNADEINIQRDLVGYKELYKTAGEGIDFYGGLLSSGGLDENQAKEAQNQIELLKFQQNELNKAADTTRHVARSLGMNTDGFNANNTLEESQINLATNYAGAVQRALNPESVASRQRKVLNNALGAGMNFHDAYRFARNKRAELSREYQNELMSGFRNLGINEDGTINGIGIQIASKIAEENPAAAGLFSQAFASPKDAYGEANATYRKNLELNNQRQAHLANMQNDWAKLAAIQNFDWKKQKDSQEYNARMQELKSALKGTGVSDDKLAQEISSVMRNTGLPQEVATEMVLRQHYSNSFKVPRDADGNIKTSDAEKVKNFTSRRFAIIEYFLGKNDRAQATEFINNYRNALASDDFKYAEQLDGASVTWALNVLDMYEKVANGEISLEEIKNSRSHISAADLSRDNHDTTANQNAKKIKENQAQKQARNNTESPKIWYSTDFTNPFIEKNPLDLKFKDTSR